MSQSCASVFVHLLACRRGDSVCVASLRFNPNPTAAQLQQQQCFQRCFFYCCASVVRGVLRELQAGFVRHLLGGVLPLIFFG
jgi:hypothetical protein